MTLATTAPEIAPKTDSDRLIDALDRFRREIESQLGPAVAGEDPEALHDLRVAVRRTRSGLKHSAGVLSRKQRRRFQEEFSRLQDITGPARDYEVWMAALPDDDPLRFVLAGYHEEARRAAVTALSSRHTKQLLARWHTRLASLRSGKTAISSEDRIGTQHRRVIEVAAGTDPSSDAADLHRVRKRAKELRYLIELFATDETPPARLEMRKQLKKMQDALGDVQDAAVQREWLNAHADEVGPIDVRLKEIDERDAVARAAYGERFTQFVSIE
jgi:CHAD domain-containing protein